MQMKRLTKAEAKALGLRVSRNNLVLNIVLMMAKLMAGVLGHSAAMISDAVHTGADIFSNLVVMMGLRISHQDPSEEYEYGYGRFESIAALVLSFILFLAGAGIGVSVIKSILLNEVIEKPGNIALLGALLSIVVKEGMFRYTKTAAKKINSDVLMADAWHHRSDVLSSIGSLVGVFGAIIGFPILDPLAGIIISGMIIMSAWEIFVDATKKLTDASLSQEIVDEMEETIWKVRGVEGINSIMTRQFGSQSYVDVEIEVNGFLPLIDAHDIAVDVHDKLEEEFDEIIHVMVHVDPK